MNTKTETTNEDRASFFEYVPARRPQVKRPVARRPRRTR